MKTFKRNRKTVVAASAVGVVALGLGALGVHLGCGKIDTGSISGVTGALSNALGKGGGGGQSSVAPTSGGGGGGGGVLGAIGSMTGREKEFEMAAATLEIFDAATMNTSKEDQMGQGVALSLTNTYELSENEKLSKYVSMVGLTVAESSSRPVGNWVFGVLDTDAVNAFAGPNGYIFVTRGALAKMEDESELAGVLAHEITHVLHHHGLAGVKTNNMVDGAKRLAAAADSRIAAAGPLVDLGTDVVIKKGYGKAQELNADEYAVNLLVAAGYDPNGLVRFLQRLESSGGDLMSTHPGKAERVQRAQSQIARMGHPKGKTLKARFEKNVNLE
jgi:predicted Zn-dependent protease